MAVLEYHFLRGLALLNISPFPRRRIIPHVEGSIFEDQAAPMQKCPRIQLSPNLNPNRAKNPNAITYGHPRPIYPRRNDQRDISPNSAWCRLCCRPRCQRPKGPWKWDGLHITFSILNLIPAVPIGCMILYVVVLLVFYSVSACRSG